MNIKTKINKVLINAIVDARLGKTGITNKAIVELQGLLAELELEVAKKQLATITSIANNNSNLDSLDSNLIGLEQWLNELKTGK